MNTLIKNCSICNKEFTKPYTRSIKNWSISKYCSNECRLQVFKKTKGYWLGKKREISWNIGVKQSEEHKRKMVETRIKNGTYRKLTNEERKALLPIVEE